MMRAYNVVQIVVCSYMTWGLLPVVGFPNVFGIDSDFTARGEWFVLVHYLSKFLDWFDTFFIVAKGNARKQLSFLHVYVRRAGSFSDDSRRRRGWDADRPLVGRGDAAAATRTVRGDGSRSRRGQSAETGRGRDADNPLRLVGAATRTVRGDGSRSRRG